MWGRQEPVTSSGASSCPAGIRHRLRGLRAGLEGGRRRGRWRLFPPRGAPAPQGPSRGVGHTHGVFPIGGEGSSLPIRQDPAGARCGARPWGTQTRRASAPEMLPTVLPPVGSPGPGDPASGAPCPSPLVAATEITGGGSQTPSSHCLKTLQRLPRVPRVEPRVLRGPLRHPQAGLGAPSGVFPPPQIRSLTALICHLSDCVPFVSREAGTCGRAHCCVPSVVTVGGTQWVPWKLSAW